MKIQVNPQRQIQIDSVAALLRTVQEGGTISYADVRNATKVDPTNYPNGYSIVYAAREKLMAEGYTFRVDKGTGFRRLGGSSTTLDDVRRRRIRGQTKRRKRELNGVDVHGLSMDEQQTYAVEVMRNRLVENTMKEKPALPSSRAPTAPDKTVVDVMRRALQKALGK